MPSHKSGLGCSTPLMFTFISNKSYNSILMQINKFLKFMWHFVLISSHIYKEIIIIMIFDTVVVAIGIKWVKTIE